MRLGTFALSLSLAAGCSAGDAAPNTEATKQAIINGAVSTATQDATVMLVANGAFTCTATLIAPNLVITARHCVASALDETNECGPAQGDLPASAFSVATGVNATEAKAIGHGVKLYVPTTTNLCGFDVALVQLDSDVTDARVARVRFAPVTQDEPVVAVGYGSTRDGEEKAPSRMQRATKVVAIGPTSQRWTPQTGQPIDYDVAAGDLATGESTCFGDSGGPLFDDNGDLVAVTSRGIDGECNDRPSLFASVNAHEDLIRQAAAAAGHDLAQDAAPADPGDTAEADPDTDDTTTAHRASTSYQKTASSGCAATPNAASSPSALALIAFLFGTIAASFRRRS